MPTNADSSPAIAAYVYKNGSIDTTSGLATAITATLAPTTSRPGAYAGSFANPSTYGYVAGDVVDIWVEGAVGGVAFRAPIFTTRLVNRVTTDANGRVQIQPGTGAGQLSLSSGLVSLAGSQSFDNSGQTTKLPVNVQQIAGQNAIASGSVTFPSLISNLTGTPQTGDAYAAVTGLSIPTASANASAVWGAGSRTLTALPSLPNVTVGGYATNLDPATMVLGATASAWNNAGTIGTKINAAGTASDPWSVALPGAYASGTAGNLLGNRLDAAISTRLATSGYTAPPTFPANFALLSIDGTGKVTFGNTSIGSVTGSITVGGYATGQDPVSLLDAASMITISAVNTSNGVAEVLTKKQYAVLLGALQAGDSTPTAPVASGSAPLLYYIPGQAKSSGTLVATATVTFDAGKAQVNRHLVVQNPFPTIP